MEEDESDAAAHNIPGILWKIKFLTVIQNPVNIPRNKIAALRAHHLPV
jgi:hypothetical protein